MWLACRWCLDASLIWSCVVLLASCFVLLFFSPSLCRPVTGNAMSEDTQTFLAAGANSVLAKPTNKAALVAMLEHLHILQHETAAAGKKKNT